MWLWQLKIKSRLALTKLFWGHLAIYRDNIKLKCSNKIDHENKDLWDDHDDIMKLVKKFNVNKERLKEKIKREKEDDPSEEIFNIDKMLKICEIKVKKS